MFRITSISRLFLPLFLPLLLLAAPCAELSAAPATLADGTAIEIGRAGSKVYVLSPDGRRSPLWNGVHTLASGARLTIRGGVLSSVPWQSGGGRPRQDACVTLIERVCGRDRQCSDGTACELAQQLQTLEAEARAARRPGLPPATSSQCDQALLDVGYFKPCRQ